MSFPSGFVWGAAAAAYQIEGAVDADGRRPCIWQTFCDTEGNIADGQSGATACDHYHRFREDVALMREIGLGAYRLSVAWPRVLPNGSGTVNAKGLDFYDAVVDECLAAGITPYVTLFHWDFPQALYERGGWLNRESAVWFAEFVRAVVDRLSDRVEHWITINEPQVFLSHGHLEGIHAPGDKLSLKEVLQAGHHVLLAHGRAVQSIREAAHKPPQIGYAPMGVVKMPASSSPADVDAARRAMTAVPKDHLFCNTWWMDPVLLGRYPEDGLRAYGSSAPEVHDGDLEIINQPLDFLGLNTYFGDVVQAGPGGDPETIPHAAGYAQTSYHWPVTPEVLYWGPKTLFERYGVPIYITENGMSNADCVSLDGRVHDPQRIDYVQRHLLALERAVDDGVDVRGYFHWSILDNFEWAEGYRERFGLIHVDYSNQRRTLKDSAYWYNEIIASNGRTLSAPYAGAIPASGRPEGDDTAAGDAAGPKASDLLPTS
ncbi:MAG: beta-glucosidase [bacterium]|nr:beta-glucosidase [bacterium]